jgi:hypothetical protein
VFGFSIAQQESIALLLLSRLIEAVQVFFFRDEKKVRKWQCTSACMSVEGEDGALG